MRRGGSMVLAALMAMSLRNPGFSTVERMAARTTPARGYSVRRKWKNSGSGRRKRDVPAHIQEQLIADAKARRIRRSDSMYCSGRLRDMGYYRCNPGSNNHRFVTMGWE